MCCPQLGACACRYHSETSTGSTFAGPPSSVRPSARRVKPVDETFADVLDEVAPDTTPSIARDPLLDVPPASRAAFGADEVEGREGAGHEAPLMEDGTVLSENQEANPENPVFLPNAERIAERQALMRELSLEQLLERTLNYLRSTSNEKLVDAEEEDILFPVIIERFKEFSVDQLLEIVSVLHARSTLVRYGIRVNDMVRDRIAVIATTAAKQRRTAVQSASAGTEANEEDSLFVDEEEERKRLAAEDPVLRDAANQITPDTVLRCLLVMGMSPRRKRDLVFFHTIGAYFAFFVNHYKDPHDLVRVLTAFARAKILPPKAFLSMLSRRFPVLCKNSALETLPSYRAMVNFAKMGHDHMNIYRFLSDNMLATMEANINEKRKNMMITQRMQEQTSKIHHQSATDTEATTKSKVDSVQILSASVDATRIKARFHELVGVKPSMFTKWIFILAKNGAPYQQYLRPLIHPVIIPMLGHFPPPSFTRLLSAINFFKCDDPDILEPIIDYMCNNGTGEDEISKERDAQQEAEQPRPYCPTRADLFVLLTMFSREGTALPQNVDKFFSYCGRVLLESSLATTLESVQKKINNKKKVFKDEDQQFILRPGDMCTVARHLVQLQRRVEISLEALAPLTELMGLFAHRLLALLELRVVSVLQVDDFADLCRQQHYPDEDGSLEKLMAKRREMAAFVDEDGMTDELDELALDIDVRETFFKIVLVNDAYRYIAYRPLPGSLQVDFREALTKVSALDLLHAVDLYERCFPSALKPPVRLLLTRSFLAKFSVEGEEVISDDKTELVLRPPEEQFVTRADLENFVNLLSRTPMNVQNSADLKRFLEKKAHRLGLQEQLKKLSEQHKLSCVAV